MRSYPPLALRPLVGRRHDQQAGRLHLSRRRLDRHPQADQRTYWAYQGDDPLVELSDPDGLGGGVSPALSHRYFYGSAVDQVLAIGVPLPPGEGQGE